MFVSYRLITYVSLAVPRSKIPVLTERIVYKIMKLKNVILILFPQMGQIILLTKVLPSNFFCPS